MGTKKLERKQKIVLKAWPNEEKGMPAAKAGKKVDKSQDHGVEACLDRNGNVKLHVDLAKLRMFKPRDENGSQQKITFVVENR